MNVKFFGCGAAGNKVGIKLIEDNLFNKEDVLLINSTSKDIPDDYQDIQFIFAGPNGEEGGCGKERTKGKDMFLYTLQQGNFKIENYITNQVNDFNLAIVCGSTEGGTGSSVIPILSRYIDEELHIPVLVILIFGFEDDVRGLRNSIEICQELTDNLIVTSISNVKCNRITSSIAKAEDLANEHIETFIRIMIGKDIRASSQNLDQFELRKLVSTPGYIVMGRVPITGVKNRSAYDDAISSYIDDACYIESPPDSGGKRIGLVVNAKGKTLEAIDRQSTILKREYKEPGEEFIHIQDPIDGEEWVDYMVSGLKLPIQHLQYIHQEYIDRSSKIDKAKDPFFDIVRGMQGLQEDLMFDTYKIRGEEETNKKGNFFSSFNMSPPETSETNQTKTDPPINVTTVPSSLKNNTKDY